MSARTIWSICAGQEVCSAKVATLVLACIATGCLVATTVQAVAAPIGKHSAATTARPAIVERQSQSSNGANGNTSGLGTPKNE